MLRDAGEKLVEKKEWDPIRPARPRFRNMSHKDRQLLVNMDPRYGQVICRCENITEGEIIAEIHSPVPARTYDAIKRRTWLKYRALPRWLRICAPCGEYPFERVGYLAVGGDQAR